MTGHSTPRLAGSLTVDVQVRVDSRFRCSIVIRLVENGGRVGSMQGVYVWMYGVYV